MRKFWIALMIVALAPSVGMSQIDGDRHDRPRYGGKRAMLKELNLDKEQLAKIRKLRRDMQRNMIEQRSRMGLARLDFQEELHKDKPDGGRLDKLIDQIASAQGQMARNRFKMQVEMTRILTPEQKQKMLERMGARMLGEERGFPGKGRGKRHIRERERRHDDNF